MAARCRVFLLCLAMQGPLAGAAGDSASAHADDAHGHHFEPSWVSVATAILVLATILLVVTIIFEKLKELVVASTSETTAPIIASLSQELAILGFLSIGVFLLVQTKVLEGISIAIWGDGDHQRELLFHSVEQVHYTLSFVMITFLAHTLYLYRRCGQSMKDWRTMDKISRDESQLEERRAFLKDTKELSMNWVQRLRLKQRRRRALALLKFHSMRKEFVQGRMNVFPYRAYTPADTQQQLPEDFDYGYYLNLALGKYLSEVIDVGIPEWGVIWIFLVIWFLVEVATGDRQEVHAWLWVYFYYMIIAFIAWFQHYVSTLRYKVLNPADLAGLTIPSDHLLLHRYASVDKYDKPVWAQEAYERESKPGYKRLRRPKWRRKLQGKAPNAYQSIFLFQARGARFQSCVFTVHLVLMSTYLAIICIYYAKKVYEFEGPGLLALYIVMALAPVVFSLWKLEIILLRRIVHLNYVASLRNTQLVSQVLRSQKTSRAVRSLVLLQSMKHTVVDKQLDRCVALPMTLSFTDAYRRKLGFSKSSGADEDKDGDDCDEGVSQRPAPLKLPQCSVHLEVAMARAGGEGSGTPSSRSQAQRHGLSGTQRQPVDAGIHVHNDDVAALFDIYDADNSGSIDRQEMRDLLLSLGIILNDVQLERMYRMVDTDGDGNISREEFMAWHLVETTAEATRHVTPRSLAEELFSLFEHEDGAISVLQFKEGLDRFNAKLTIDEVASIVRELDADGDGRINIDEFAAMLERYAHVDERHLAY